MNLFKQMCFYNVHAEYDTKKDPTFKIKSFYNHIIEKSRRLYYPKRELTIDESMIKYKGAHTLRRFMPKKPIRYESIIININKNYLMV